MNLQAIAARRMVNQRLVGEAFTTPEQAVKWLGAVQAQDYHGAKWSLGLRLKSSTDALIEQAYDEGRILRTHVMRPTWHFVTPEDIRWMLNLTAHRIHRINANYYRRLELEDATLTRAKNCITKAAEGGHFLTRNDIVGLLERENIRTDGLRLVYILMWLELDQIICSGPRDGKQFTYALMDERAPDAKVLPAEEALVELMHRFFVSHGPATLDDFARWSGLTKTDAKRGIVALQSELICDDVDGETYWFSPEFTPAPLPEAIILPFFDEYTIAYKGRSAFLAPEYETNVQEMLLGGSIVLCGQVVGSWRRVHKTHTITLELAPFRKFSTAERDAIHTAVEDYARFLGVAAVIA